MKSTKFETNFNKHKYLSSTVLLSNTKYNNQEKNLINIYPEMEYQEVLGFRRCFYRIFWILFIFT